MVEDNKPSESIKVESKSKEEHERKVEPIRHHSDDEKTINIKKSTLWQMSTGLFAILFVISLFTGGFQGSDNGTGGTVIQQGGSPTITQRNIIPTGISDVSADDDPVKGDPNAPVEIIEFSDFECPFCGRFYDQTLPQIEEQYIKTGKVKLVYRDFPLSFHPKAQPAAEAGECADDQGKFWEMHDKIFDNQASLSEASLIQWGEDIGLDMDEFNECIESGKHKTEIQKDLNEGQAAGVSGTPGFFINGKLIVGAQPFSVFQSAIEAELA